MRTTLYKATRPDGTDFRTGRIDYAAALASGELVRHPNPERYDGPAGYLSVATVPTDCTGMRWPARLFTVEPEGETWTAGSGLPNKRCCHALRVTADLPAHEVFGPQGRQVVALLDALPTFTAQRWNAAHAAWNAARDAAQYAAWDAAWDAAQDAARCATALVVRDLITAEQFAVLWAPDGSGRDRRGHPWGVTIATATGG